MVLVQDALDIAVRMCLAIPLADIMAYRKVSHRAGLQYPAACFSLSAAAQLCSRASQHLTAKQAAQSCQPYSPADRTMLEQPVQQVLGG